MGYSRYACTIVVFVCACVKPVVSESYRKWSGDPSEVYPRVVGPTDYFKNSGNFTFPTKLYVQLNCANATIFLSLEMNTISFPQWASLNHSESSTENGSLSHACYYQGSVLGYQNSMVAVSLCGGLTGMIDLGSRLLYIEPRNIDRRNLIEDLSRLHVLYPVISMMGDSQCSKPALKLPTSNLQTRRRRQAFRSADTAEIALRTVKYLELYMVNDLSIYEQRGRNLSAVIERTKEVVNMIDARYRALRMRVVLVGIEVWTEQNLIVVTNSSHDTLINFMRYREERINRRVRNDNAQFVTAQPFDDGTTAGKAGIATICSFKYSAGINRDSNKNPTFVANVIAHELGHSLGMLHDQDDCICPEHERKRCMMNPKMDLKVSRFSECSARYLEETLLAGYGHCLFDTPEDGSNPPVCGNGLIEKGEECDCGHVQNCAKSGYCCDAVRCVLHKNATCSGGGCCVKCQLAKQGVMCRKEREECDLPEYCNGISNECPVDLHVQDAEECGSGGGYCFGGSCRTHDDQCRSIFGNSSRSAPGRCFQQLNAMGTTEGFCKFDGNSHTPCQIDDSFCGKLQCVTVAGTTSPTNSAPWLHEDADDQSCVSILDHKKAGRSDQNRWLTREGTKCGAGRICAQHQCIPVGKFASKFGPVACKAKCRQHGVCNNNGNCHCDLGWQPPYCDRSGYGGSIDSGSQRAKVESLTAKGLKGWLRGRPGFAIITFLAILLVATVLATAASGLYKLVKKFITSRDKSVNHIRASELAALIGADNCDARKKPVNEK